MHVLNELQNLINQSKLKVISDKIISQQLGLTGSYNAGRTLFTTAQGSYYDVCHI